MHKHVHIRMCMYLYIYIIFMPVIFIDLSIFFFYFLFSLECIGVLISLQECARLQSRRRASRARARSLGPPRQARHGFRDPISPRRKPRGNCIMGRYFSDHFRPRFVGILPRLIHLRLTTKMSFA